MGRLDYDTRIYLAEMISAFIKRDYRRMAEYHFIAGYVPADQNVEAFAQACRSIGEPVLGQELSRVSIGRLLAQLFKITETFQMHTQPQLLLFQKSLILIESICRRLEPKTDMWGWSEAPIRQWMESELGLRGKIKHHTEETLKLLRTLPQLAERADKWLQRMEKLADSDDAATNNGNRIMTGATLLALGITLGLLL
jgi:ubiquinone biosynthesis protein